MLSCTKYDLYFVRLHGQARSASKPFETSLYSSNYFFVIETEQHFEIFRVKRFILLCKFLLLGASSSVLYRETNKECEAIKESGV